MCAARANRPAQTPPGGQPSGRSSLDQRRWHLFNTVCNVQRVEIVLCPERGQVGCMTLLLCAL